MSGHGPRTLADAKATTYGYSWQVFPYRPGDCAETVVVYRNRWPIYSQCRRKACAGPDSLYCKQHASRYIDPAPPAGSEAPHE